MRIATALMRRWVLTALGVLLAISLALACVTVPAAMVARATSGAGGGGGSGGSGGGTDGGGIWAGVTYAWGTWSGGSSTCTWSHFMGDSNGGGTPGADFNERRENGVLYRLFMRVCPTGQRLVWVPQVPPQVIQHWASAFLLRWLPRPAVHLAPPAGHLVVTVPTWFWTDWTSWRPVSVTVSIPTPSGVMWVTTTAVPRRLLFEPGDAGRSGAVVCPGPGVPWIPAFGDEMSSPTGCEYTYQHSSQRREGGAIVSGHIAARLSIEWTVTWRASTGAAGSGGSIRTSTPAPVSVREIHAVGSA